MTENSNQDANAGNAEVVVYGSTECPYTARARKWLEGWGIDYQWVDVEADPAAAEQIAAWNEGRAIRPTLDIGGAVFVNPDQSVLHNELKTRGLL